MIAIDEEGGDVTRLAHLTGSPYPGNAALGAVDDVSLTRAVYRALGTDLAAVGINVDLAPSVDVNTATGNPVIGTRAFGRPHRPGEPACGRGGARPPVGRGGRVRQALPRSRQHHATTPTTWSPPWTGGLARVRERDLPPFAAAIAAGVAAVMPGHLRVAGLTGDLPATQSPAALGGLLRGELGFTGVIISDALEMRAVSGQGGVPSAAVRAVAAGVDLLCLGRDQDEEDYLAVRAALAAAVTAGELPAARLEEAAARVARFRAALAAGALPGAGPGTPGLPGPGTLAGAPAAAANGDGDRHRPGGGAARAAGQRLARAC